MTQLPARWHSSRQAAASFLFFALPFFSLFFGCTEPWSEAIIFAATFLLAALAPPRARRIDGSLFLALGLFAIAFLAFVQALNFIPAGAPASGFLPSTSSAYASRAAAIRWASLGALAWAAPGVMRERPIRLAWTFAGAGVVIAVAGLIQDATGSRYLLGLRHDLGWEPFGPFFYRNHAATFLAQAVCVGAGLLAQTFASPRRGHRASTLADRIARFLTLGLLLLLVAFALWRTRSLGGAASALGALAISFIAMRFRSRTMRFSTVGLLTIGGAAVLLAPILLSSPSSPRLNTHSMLFRKAIFRSSASMISDRPLFGHGVGAFSSSFPRFQGAEPRGIVQHAHNDYLELAAEGGMFSLGLLCAAFFAAFFVGSGGEAPPRGPEYPGLVAAVLATFLHAFIDFPLRNAVVAVNLVLLISLLWTSPEKQAAPVNPTAPWWRGIFFVLLASAAIRPLVAEAYLLRASKAPASSQDYFLLSALRWDPAPKTSRKLATYYLKQADLTPGAGLPLLRRGLAFAEEALREEPFHPVSLYTRGAILYRLGRREDAEADFRAYIRLRAPS